MVVAGVEVGQDCGFKFLKRSVGYALGQVMRH